MNAQSPAPEKNSPLNWLNQNASFRKLQLWFNGLSGAKKANSCGCVGSIRHSDRPDGVKSRCIGNIFGAVSWVSVSWIQIFCIWQFSK
ncbi:asl0814 [Nostoc sp. PCC 7120 = FACHB-418]|nr:asl0814 [Nostoc sp. PCC 7120 = FACHB-418]